MTDLHIRAAHLVPPSETRSVAVQRSHVVKVVMLCTRPKREKVSKRPREIVTRVCVNGLESSESHPNVDSEDVKIGSCQAIEERT